MKLLRQVACGIAAVLTLGMGACTSVSGTARPYQVCLLALSGTWQDAELTDSARRGLVEAHQEYGADFTTAEADSVGAAQQRAKSWAQGDCDLIIGMGVELEGVIHTLAQSHPDKNFALVGSYFLDQTGQATYLRNGRPILFNAAEGSFLAGYLAAGMSQTGKVAAFGGLDTPHTRLYLDGFAGGISAYNAKHHRNIELLGWDKTSQTGVFTGSETDEAAVQQQTQNFIAAGADLIMPVTGVSARGAIPAASQAGEVWLIGTDGRWVERPEAAGVFLTAVTQDAAAGVIDTVAQAISPNNRVLAYVATLANSGVGLDPYYGVAGAVDDQFRAELDDTAKLIISGKLWVGSPSTPLPEGQPWRSN
ncbi:MAG: BMP family ABC transporter substrate-binding protein [Trueperella sp.]|nr:BMP family ABC transporter substrate-binding protein [Trueperella sp.]